MVSMHQQTLGESDTDASATEDVDLYCAAAERLGYHALDCRKDLSRSVASRSLWSRKSVRHHDRPEEQARSALHVTTKNAWRLPTASALPSPTSAHPLKKRPPPRCTAGSPSAQPPAHQPQHDSPPAQKPSPAASRRAQLLR